MDSSFDEDGKQTIDFGTGKDLAYSLAVDYLDRIVLAGSSNQLMTGNDFAGGDGSDTVIVVFGEIAGSVKIIDTGIGALDVNNLTIQSSTIVNSSI